MLPRSVTLKNTVTVFSALATLYIFNDVFSKHQSHINLTKSTAPGLTPSPLQMMTPNSIEGVEKLRNYLLLKSVPSGQ